MPVYALDGVSPILPTDGRVWIAPGAQEGKEFPDDSLIIGSPARLVRTLDEASAGDLRDSAAQYWRQRVALRQRPGGDRLSG